MVCMRAVRMWLKMEGDDSVGNHDACGPNHAAAGGDGRAAAADRTCLRPATLFNELGGLHGANQEGNASRNR